jgi:glutaredoxin
MARLVVYGSSVPCPDMRRFQRWLERHQVDGMLMLDIHGDRDAMARVKTWTGHASVPTLVIAHDRGIDPIEPPAPLSGGRVRAVDRGTLLTEPDLAQIVPFLQRHGIVVRDRHAAEPARADTGTVEPASPDGMPTDDSAPAVRTITVYPITGRQLFFRVPHSWCEECDLTIRTVQQVIDGHDHLELRVKPWINNIVDALRRGGWHAPVVTIDGNLFSQGLVPDANALRLALGLPAGEKHEVGDAA